MSVEYTYQLPYPTETVLNALLDEEVLKTKCDHWGYEDVQVVSQERDSQHTNQKMTMRLKSKLVLPMFRKWMAKISALEVNEHWDYNNASKIQGSASRVCDGMGLTVKAQMILSAVEPNLTEFKETMDASFKNALFKKLGKVIVNFELKSRKRNEREMLISAIESFQSRLK